MADAKLHKTLQGHTDSVYSVAFSPDSTLLASASRDKTVRLWNVPTGELIAELKGHKGTVHSLAFCPDGQSIVTASFDKTLRTWSVATKQQLKTLNGHEDRVWSVAWSPNGDVIASGSDDRTVILWDTISGSMKKTLEGHNFRVYSVSFSQNGNKLASAGYDFTAIIWDVNSGAALIKLAHPSHVYSVCFSPDDQFVVTGGKNEIVRIFNANNGDEEKQFEGHTKGVNSVACSFDGSMIASGSNDHSVRLWDVASTLWDVTPTKQLHQLDGHTKVGSVAFSRDGKYIASASIDNTVCLWNAPSSLQSEMEARQQLEVEQQEIDMNSLRECACCHEINDSSYLLPCLHLTCSRCVDDMVQDANQKKRKRPSCCCGETFLQDKLTTVPSATLPTPTCFDCDEPATHYCGDCKSNMCKLHGNGHFTSKRFKDHVVQLVAEVPFCHKHSTETALGFCTHCKVLICVPCGFAEHSKPPHLSIPLQEAAKIISDCLKNDVARLVGFAPSINKDIQKYKNICKKLETERAELEDKIADIRKQEKVATLKIDRLENTQAVLLATQKQANALAARATTLPHSTLVRLQNVITARVSNLRTGLMISRFFQ